MVRSDRPLSVFQRPAAWGLGGVRRRGFIKPHSSSLVEKHVLSEAEGTDMVSTSSTNALLNLLGSGGKLYSTLFLGKLYR